MIEEPVFSSTIIDKDHDSDAYAVKKNYINESYHTMSSLSNIEVIHKADIIRSGEEVAQVVS